MKERKLGLAKRLSAMALALVMVSRRPSGLRKTSKLFNSLAHRTTWLRSDFLNY